jgi:hypothetical protein
MTLVSLHKFHGYHEDMIYDTVLEMGDLICIGTLPTKFNQFYVSTKLMAVDETTWRRW